MSTGATTNFQIPLFGDSDFVTPIQTPLNAQSNALDAALTNSAFLRSATKAAAPAGTSVGQHLTVYADPTPSLNGDYVWSGTTWLVDFNLASPPAFATAVGYNAAVAATGVTTITFPAGRFIVPPAVQVTVSSTAGSAPGFAWRSATATATNFTVRIFNTAAAQIGGTIDWTATQQTPTSAAG